MMKPNHEPPLVLHSVAYLNIPLGAFGKIMHWPMALR
jgi:hypothetical protein